MSVEEESPSTGDEAPTAANTDSSGRELVSSETERHRYLYASGKLLRETVTGGTGSKTLDFLYDNNGTPYALRYSIGSGSPVTYYYITNLQGDVTALIDSSKKVVATYEYDPYGKILTVQGLVNGSLKDVSNDPNHVANANPLRYRGYYYDSETGFYYLQSRYYDPAVCRFINADSTVTTGQKFLGFNMFAYCNNDPVNLSDINGAASIWYYLIQACQYGYIHICAQKQIILNAQLQGAQIEKELWLQKDGKLIGRADLMRPLDGAIWEVKHAGKNPAVRIMAAEVQLATYMGSTAVRNGREVTHKGEAGAFSGSFVINCLNDSFLVEYDTPADGVVLYRVKQIEHQKVPEYTFEVVPVKEKEHAKSVTSALGVAVGAGLGYGIGYGLGGAGIGMGTSAQTQLPMIGGKFWTGGICCYTY